jgi:16S rRNA G1207 methylase RsmC
VFSRDELDAGSRALIETMVIRSGEAVLDLVANRFIRYERMMSELFSRVTTAYEDNRFRVLVAEGKRQLCERVC